MADKRRRQPRNTGRRGSPGCLSVLFLMVVIIAVAVAAIFIFFKMNTIEVIGAEHYTDTRVIEAAGAEIGSNLVFISKGSMKRGIISELPYVAEVEISRRLPSTLVITVTETEAAAYFDTDGAYWICDEQGKLLERTTAEPQKLIRVEGPKPVTPVEGTTVDLGEESELRLRTFRDTLAALDRAEMIGDVQKMDISGLYDVSIEYGGRFTVDFGAPEDLEYKIEYLREIVNKKLTPNQKGSIDLSKLIEKGEARFIEEY